MKRRLTVGQATRMDASQAHGPRQAWGIKLRGLSTEIRGRTALSRLSNARRIIICACGTSCPGPLKVLSGSSEVC